LAIILLTLILIYAQNSLEISILKALSTAEQSESYNKLFHT